MRKVMANSNPTMLHNSSGHRSLMHVLSCSLCRGKGGGGKLLLWGQLGDISWHRDALDVSAERLTSPDTELGHGRKFPVVRQGLKHAKVGFPLLAFSLEQTGINLCIPSKDYADGCTCATSSHPCDHSLAVPYAPHLGHGISPFLTPSLFPGAKFIFIVCPKTTLVSRQNAN